MNDFFVEGNRANQGTIVFSYDQFSNLVSAKESGVEAVFRTTDCVGNLYETTDQSDRIYGAGSRLEQSVINLNERRNRYQGGQGKLVTKGFSFCYDEEGNLARKTGPDGDTWSYTYYGNGMLKEVTRPDQSNVRFKYDPFGRRFEKSVTAACGDEIPQKKQKKVVRFLWDGNTLLHEWEENSVTGSRAPESKASYRADYVLKLEREGEEKAREEAQKGKRPPENLITWVFQDDFIPRGKITKEGSYSIISDYLGTPVEAYDETGEKVWEQELDIYGRVKSSRKDIQGRTEREAGDENFIPFRFQGQYEDEETGLYYNRFRYYSPEDGCYTQQDPIGLAGENPTMYGYVGDPNWWLDPFGLDRMPLWMHRRQGYQRHHIIPYSVWQKNPLLQNSGLDVNDARNMIYLPMWEGVDLDHPNSSLHFGNNKVHVQYNATLDERVKDLAALAEQNNWSQSELQEEIGKLQDKAAYELREGELRCH